MLRSLLIVVPISSPSLSSLPIPLFAGWRNQTPQLFYCTAVHKSGLTEDQAGAPNRCTFMSMTAVAVAQFITPSTKPTGDLLESTSGAAIDTFTSSSCNEMKE